MYFPGYIKDYIQPPIKNVQQGAATSVASWLTEAESKAAANPAADQQEEESKTANEVPPAEAAESAAATAREGEEAQEMTKA